MAERNPCTGKYLEAEPSGTGCEPMRRRAGRRDRGTGVRIRHRSGRRSVGGTHCWGREEHRNQTDGNGLQLVLK